MDGFEVRRDGIVVDSESWGSPVPVDAGEHEVVASAPGRLTWSATITVRGEAERISVDVPSLGAPPAPGETTPKRAPAAKPAKPASSNPSAPLAPPPVQTMSSLATAGIVVASVGIAGVGTGVVLGLLAKADHASPASAVQDCRASPCFSSGSSETSGLGTAGTVAVVAGSVAFLSGVVIWGNAPWKNARAKTANVRFSATPGGFMAAGVF
jgi:hypothetical protein